MTMKKWYGIDSKDIATLTPDDYAEALKMFGEACDLHEVVAAFAKAMLKICEANRLQGGRVEEENWHPIAVLYAARIAEITGCASPDILVKSRATVMKVVESWQKWDRKTI